MTQTQQEVLTIVEALGGACQSCGYCRSDEPTSTSYGMWAHQMSVEAYEKLLNRCRCSMPTGPRSKMLPCLVTLMPSNLCQRLQGLEAQWEVLVLSSIGHELLPTLPYPSRCAQV